MRGIPRGPRPAAEDTSTPDQPENDDPEHEAMVGEGDDTNRFSDPLGIAGSDVEVRLSDGEIKHGNLLGQRVAGNDEISQTRVLVELESGRRLNVASIRASLL